MEPYLNSQNIIRKYLKKENLGEPLLYLPYITSTMHNPCGNLPIYICILLNQSIPIHGLTFNWSKYLRKITEVT
jgi:hypothetical protein